MRVDRRHDTGPSRFSAAIGWRVAGVLLLIALVWGLVKAFGWALGLVFASPVLGGVAAFLFPRVLSGVRWHLRWQAWKNEHGTHRTFHNQPVKVEWAITQAIVCADDAAKVLGLQLDAATVRRLSLALTEQGFFRGDDGRHWFTAVALVQWLRKRESIEDRRAIQFRHWLETAVLPPLYRQHGKTWPPSVARTATDS